MIVGTTVAGSIDLLIETDKGFWIIDHNSDRTEDFDAIFSSYLLQLMDYANAVAKVRSDKKVLGVGINRVSFGDVA